MDISLIKDMDRAERPRERLLTVGVEGLHSEELLALVLRTGFSGHGALDVARTILRTHPLESLLRLSVQRMAELRGMGISRAASLLAGAELGRRAGGSVEDGLPYIRSMSDVVAQALEYRSKKKEHLVAFFLNARHQLIAKEVISIGTLTASLAHPREIFAPAIGKAAAGIILLHNHPSGDPSPSDDDIRLTKRIAQAGVLMGIDLLDHLIIAETGCYSFKTSGGLP